MKHIERSAYGKTDPTEVRLYELLAGVKSGAHSIKEAYDGILELGATRTPAPGVEEVVEELDRLANIYGWHHEKCAGHSHFPSCPVVKLRRMLVTLTTHQQEKEALVAKLEAMEYSENDADGNHSYDRARQREGYDYAKYDAITIIRDTLKS